MQGIVSGILLVAAFAAVMVAAALLSVRLLRVTREEEAACLATLARPPNCTRSCTRTWPR